MQLLVRPKPYADESLESYLLRLSDENGYESYTELAGALKAWLKEHDHEAAGALPLSLALVNIHHANRSSSLRVRALRLVEQLTDLRPSSLLGLALLHSSARFGLHHKAVHRQGIDIPQCFVRNDAIPVCPLCLQEKAYIRQHWHYLPYVACHRHGIQLLHRCPDCGHCLDYRADGSIMRCRQCGFDLRHGKAPKATVAQVAIASRLNGIKDGIHPLLGIADLAHVYGVILWWSLRQVSNNDGIQTVRMWDIIDYFTHWPANFHAELAQQVERAKLMQVTPFNRCSFSSVFGNLLPGCRELPSRNVEHNIVLGEVVHFLEQLVVDNPKERTANIADILLNTMEVAAVLSTSVEQVFRLQQEGWLTLGIRPAGRQQLDVHCAAFFLRQVIELRLSLVPRAPDGFHSYLPAW